MFRYLNLSPRRLLLNVVFIFLIPGFISAQPVWKIDFGLSEHKTGYIGIDNTALYSAEKGYGWITAPQFVRDRLKPDPILRDFVYSNNPAEFRVNLTPGFYMMTVTTGDMDFGNHALEISVPQSGIKLPVIRTLRSEFAEVTVSFKVDGEYLDIRFDSPVSNWVLNSLEFSPATEAEAVKVKKKRFGVDSSWGKVETWPDPIAPYLKDFRKNSKSLKNFKSSGLSRDDYLKVISGVVDYFIQFQNEQGAIIDPHRNEEFQYSTPCFALSAVTLVVYGGREDLLEPAARAMDWATMTLSKKKAANHHEDFYSLQIAHALPLFKPLVEPQRYARWEENIRTFDPFSTYRAGPGGGNWNVVALSGEALFHLLGLRGDTVFIEESLAAQGRFFNSPWGLYTEGPMPYDHFPRIWAADMLKAGYKGADTDKLEEVLRRGALTSLFMQSPTGELPAGGRSAHHQWNEAEQCLTYEIYAARSLEAGDEELAGVFKRAAHLSLSSVMRWIRPSGELWIVKNRYDPAAYHGYEGYSSHSQYNLLAMAMLAIAYEHAAKSEGVTERPAPADVGGFVFMLPAPHNKVFANVRGMYVEVDYAADLNYNATGLLRIHKKGFDPQLGPSDAVTNHAVYHLPERPGATAAIGAAWKNKAGQWMSLAEFGRTTHYDKFDKGPKVEITNIREKADRVSFSLVYSSEHFDGPSGIREDYVVTPDWIELSFKLEDYDGPMRLIWPVLSFNGEKRTEIKVIGSEIFVTLNGQTHSYKVSGAEDIRIDDKEYGFRNGLARLVVAEIAGGKRPRLRIKPLDI